MVVLIVVSTHSERDLAFSQEERMSSNNPEFEQVFAEDRKRKMMYAAAGVVALIILSILAVTFGLDAMGAR